MVEGLNPFTPTTLHTTRAMPERLALMLSDIVDSTRLAQTIGEAAMAALWASHDRAARDAIRANGGREIGRSDGLLACFAAAHAAAAFAAEYHRALASLHPDFRARVGLHWGEVTLRPNSAQDVATGATPLELDGVALPLAARVMSVAQGGQTLASAALVNELAAPAQALARAHGFWRFKGITEPVAVLELTAPDQPATLPPQDGSKGYRVVRQGDGEGDWAPAREIPHNLRLTRTRFFGRRETLRALAQQFDDGARLVTLLGIGGIGKTRCALAFAGHSLGDFSGGVWFCDLSAATSLQGIAYAVAHALDVPLGKGDVLKKLGSAIAGRGACLIVLDNFEQVARHAEASVGAWLAMAADAHFLITSREMLGLAGERVMPLAPLGSDDAVALFHDRAAAAGVRLDEAPSAALAQLVLMLDRLPLAIELAAARAPLLTPQQMLDRMRERFRLLAAPGVRHERQATLRATLDWSWELLDEPERQALAQVSVFEGGFTLEAAEAVVVLLTPSRAGDSWDVAEALQGLIRKSLLRTDSRYRFEMLRSVQDYAAERLIASGAQAQAQARHAALFASYDEERAGADRGVELENLVAACRRSIGREPGLAARTLYAAWGGLRLIGPFGVALELADRIEAAGALGAVEESLVDRVIGGACSLLGDPDRARKHLAACAEGAAARADNATAAAALAQLAAVELAAGHADIAESQLAEALRQLEAGADTATRIRVLSQVGAQRIAQGRYDEAEQAYEGVLRLAESAGLRRWIGGAHGNLGAVALNQGRADAARDHIERALSLARDIGDRQWEGNARCNLGLLLHEQGEHAAARTELHTALQTARAIGHKRLEAVAACNLGLAEEAQGELAAAAVSHRRALACAEELHDEVLEARFAGYLGLCLMRAQRLREAVTPLLAASRQFALVVGDAQSAATLAAQLSIAAALRSETALAIKWHADAAERASGLVLDAAGETARLLDEARLLAQGLAAGQLS